MNSTVRAPQTGDTVFVFAKMTSGKLTELSGQITEISADYAYFAMDTLELIHDAADDHGQPLERRIWPEAATLLRVGVPLDQMIPFDGTFDEDEPCWEVRL